MDIRQLNAHVGGEDILRVEWEGVWSWSYDTKGDMERDMDVSLRCMSCAMEWKG